MKKFKFFILILVLIIFTISLVGCNDVGGLSNHMSIGSFRHFQWISLPIKVTRYEHFLASVLHFRSHQSMKKIYEKNSVR